MARIPLDFSKIEDKGFDPYPPGEYTLRIIDVRQEVAKASGELKLTVNFELLDGPNGSPEYAGKKLFSSYSLQQKAGFRIAKLIAACGVPKEQMADFDDSQFLGRVIRATISNEMYQGKNYNRVGNEQPATQGGPPTAGGYAAPPPTGFAPPPQAGFAAPPNGGQQGQGWNPNVGWPGAPGTAPGFGGPSPAAPPAKPVGAK
jgi:hypothetical protein